jgi:hypothetical protein
MTSWSVLHEQRRPSVVYKSRYRRNRADTYTRDHVHTRKTYTRALTRTHTHAHTHTDTHTYMHTYM